jgi:hypothetical protein
MANYAGLSHGNELICGADILKYTTANGTLTGKTCSGVYGSSGLASISINGSPVTVAQGSTLDIIINQVGGVLSNACFICSCHDCSNPDGNAQRAVTWLSGATAPTLINPSSPYTLIGSGYLNS